MSKVTVSLRRWAVALGVSLAVAGSATAAEWYVAPGGAVDAAYTEEDPGDLYTALTNAFTEAESSEVLLLDGVYQLTAENWGEGVNKSPQDLTKGAGLKTVIRSLSGHPTDCVLDFSAYENFPALFTKRYSAAEDELRDFTVRGLRNEQSWQGGRFLNIIGSCGFTRCIGLQFVNCCNQAGVEHNISKDDSGNYCGYYGCAFVSNGYYAVDYNYAGARPGVQVSAKEFLNCLFLDNHFSKPSAVTIGNCTFIGNRSGRWGGGHDWNSSIVGFTTCFNTIFANNLLGSGTIVPYHPSHPENPASTLAHCTNCLYDCVWLGEDALANNFSNDCNKVSFAKSAKFGYYCAPVWGNWVRDQGIDYEGAAIEDDCRAYDLNGNPRMVNGAIDLGCCEAQTAASGEKALQESWVAEIPDLVPPLNGHYDVKVTVTDGEKELTEGVDYLVTAARVDSSCACEAMITGIGEYSGTVYKRFNLANNAFYCKKGGSNWGDCLSWETAGNLGRALTIAAQTGGESWAKPCEVLIPGGSAAAPETYLITDMSNGSGQWSGIYLKGEAVRDYVWVHPTTPEREGTVFTINNASSYNQNANGLFGTTAEWKASGLTFSEWALGASQHYLSGHESGNKAKQPTMSSYRLVVTNVLCRNSTVNAGTIDANRVYDTVFSNCTLSASWGDAGGFLGHIYVETEYLPPVDVANVLITDCTVNSAAPILYRDMVHGTFDNVRIDGCDLVGGQKALLYSSVQNVNFFDCRNWQVRGVTGANYLATGFNGKFRDSTFDFLPAVAYLGSVKMTAAALAAESADSSFGFERCRFVPVSDSLKLFVTSNNGIPEGGVFTLEACEFAPGTTLAEGAIAFAQPINKKAGLRIRDCRFKDIAFATKFFTAYNVHGGSAASGYADLLWLKENEFDGCSFGNQAFYWNEARNSGVRIEDNVFTNCTFESNLCAGDGNWKPTPSLADYPYQGMFALRNDQFLDCTVNATATPSLGTKGSVNGSVFCGAACTTANAATNSMSLVEGCTFRGNRYAVENSMGWAQHAFYRNCTFEDETLAGAASVRGLLADSSAYGCTFKGIAVEGEAAAASAQAAILNDAAGTGYYLENCEVTDCRGGLVKKAIVKNSLLAGNDSPSCVAGAKVYNCTIVDNAGTGCEAPAAVANSIIVSNNTALAETAADLVNVAAGKVSYSVWGTESEVAAAQGEGNLAVGTDPLFAAAGDYRLSDTSPCINTGDNGFAAYDDVDLDGRERIFLGIVDMGAYEAQPDLPTVELTLPTVPHAAVANVQGAMFEGGVWRALVGAKVTVQFSAEAGWVLSHDSARYTVGAEGELTLVAGETEPKSGRVRIGEDYFDTLADAVAAVEAGEAVTVLCDHSGAGIYLDDSRAIAFTIDLGGFTFTCTGPAVGDSGTESQALHLEKGNTVTIKNGTITVDTAAVRMLVQNYANLTLTDVTLDARESNCLYALSLNCGTVLLNGATSIYAAEGQRAFDVCVTAYYPEGVDVTINTTGTIDGIIEYDVWGSKPEVNATSLTIKNGTFDTTWSIEEQLKGEENFAISGGSFAEAVPEAYCAEGYAPVYDPETGRYGVEKVNYVVSVDGVSFRSLETAVAAATEGSELQLLNACTATGKCELAVSATLDLNGKTLTIPVDMEFAVGATLAVSDSSLLGQGRIAVTGTLGVKAGATLDLSALGLLASRAFLQNTGTFAVASGATVKVRSLSGFASLNLVAAAYPSFHKAVEDGAIGYLGDIRYTYDGAVWALDCEVARTEITQSVIVVGSYTFVESYTNVNAALSAASSSGTDKLVWLTADAVTEPADISIAAGVTLEVGAGQTPVFTGGFTAADGAKITLDAESTLTSAVEIDLKVFESAVPGYEPQVTGEYVYSLKESTGIPVVINPGTPGEETKYYATLTDAVTNQVAGTVVQFPVVTTAQSVTMKGGVTVLLDAAQAAGILTFAVPTEIAGVTIDPAIYVTPAVEAGSVELKLNRTVVNPAIASIAISTGEAAFTVATAKAGLWYGIACSDTPTGEYAVAAGGWVRCLKEGELALPSQSTSAATVKFYKLAVTDCQP